VTDVQELRDLLATKAGTALDGAGMLLEVHAGAARLRRRRRRALAAGTAGAVAAATVLVPMLVLGRQASDVRPAPGPAGPPTTQPLGGSAEITIGIAGNPTYRVTDARLEPGLTELTIWPAYADEIDTTTGEHMVDPRYRSARLMQLGPDRFDPARMRAEGERVTVSGHEAWYIPRLTAGATPESTPDPGPEQVSTPYADAVGWPGSDGSWVMLDGGDRFGRDELLTIAGLVREVPGRTVAGPLSLPYLPAGVRPWTASARGGGGTGYGNQRLAMTFALPGAAAPGTDPASATRTEVLQVGAYQNPTEVTAGAAGWGEPTRVDGKEIWHLSGNDVPTVHAGLPVVDGSAEHRHVVVIRAAGCVVTIGVTDERELAAAELDRMAREAGVGDCATPATWRPVL
jgi:hypothetical protein